MRFLYQDADAIAGVLLATAGTTVQEIFQNRQGVFYNGVGFPAFHVNYETDAAGIVFLAGFVQPCS